MKCFKKLSCLIALFIGLVIPACKEDEPDPVPEVKDAKRTILVYALGANSLDYDLTQNKKLMLAGLSGIDLDRFNFVLYEVNKKDSVAYLYKAQKAASGSMSFVSVKQYDRKTYSTDPKRVTEVIGDMQSLFPSDSYDLFLWGHGTAWQPGSATVKSAPVRRAFGWDNGYQTSNGIWIDIPDLTAAIPDGLFEMVWFDCCYMSNIETIYEFSNKCRYYVGYATEIYSTGAPYDKMIPLLLRDNPDREAAAKSVYDFYTYEHQYGTAVTVALMDMDYIEDVADVCGFMNVGSVLPDFSKLQNYYRQTSARNEDYWLYDLCQYQKAKALANGKTGYEDRLDAALENFVIYKAASEKDFNQKPIDKSNFSGVSVHGYRFSDSADEAFYSTMKWYNRTFPHLL